MKEKIQIVLVCGGQSAEHPVSLLSTRYVLSSIDRTQYEPTLVGIDRDGSWGLYEKEAFFASSEDPYSPCLPPPVKRFDPFDLGGFDLVFPILHGPLGEDGSIQGLLALIGVPFVGAKVLGSAIGMDKEVAKRLTMVQGIKTALFEVLTNPLQKCGVPFPIFVKPVALGSSIGISKVEDQDGLEEALEKAFSYGSKVLVEEAIEGVEVQCGILGKGKNLKVSEPYKIIPQGQYHSYEAKYLDSSKAKGGFFSLEQKDLVLQIQKEAAKIYSILHCEGMARVDLFLTDLGELYFNEINTIPGMTAQSVFPKVWKKMGFSFSEVIDFICQEALRNHLTTNQFERLKR